jgi:cytochrome c oxidase subunit 2
VTPPPLGYLRAAGDTARTILPLTWFTLGVSVVVCVVIGVLLWQSLRHAKTQPWPIDMRSVPVERGDGGVRWIGIGVALSAIPLFAILVWTMQALAATTAPRSQGALTLDVTARQWWWEVSYRGDSPHHTFPTANEIHIPVGQPVFVRLHGGDVIHSFWVPKLMGKTDAIPGRTNETWLRADEPGEYVGQCAEYCGVQHAHMALKVIAEPADAFETWRTHQLQPAPAPGSPALTHGAEVFQGHCAVCHEVRGSKAGAIAGPDLTHIASRTTIAAGTLANNAGTLAEWIQFAQGIKPGTLMPNQNLPPQDLVAVVSYLETLR